MEKEPACPQCSSEHSYADRNLWICPACAHEWSSHTETKTPETQLESSIIRDAHGNELHDGDSVIVIKDLKVKGSSSIVKVGTKVKNIHIQQGKDGHDISCKIEGIGAMNLKSEFVKKPNLLPIHTRI